MQRKIWKRFAILLCTLLLIALPTVACGGSEDSSSSAKESSMESTQSSEGESSTESSSIDSGKYTEEVPPPRVN